MIISDLKQKLNATDIVKILEAIGCQKIKIHGDYISSTRGNGGDNAQGVICYIDDKKKYNCLMPTTLQFDDYNVKDIITVVQIIQNLTFPEAVKFICEVCGMDYYRCQQTLQKPILKWLKSVEFSVLTGNDEKDCITILNEKTLNQFVYLPHKKWIDEGISPKTLNEFNILYDIETNSIIIPIKDELGNLVGIKCRALNENFDCKYWYLYPTNKSRLLYGEYESYKDIVKEKFVIVVESEKSVLKGHSFGIKNIVAISGKKISDIQAEKLIRMNVPIVLALDSDVTNADVKTIIQKLIFPVQTVPIYLLKDTFGLYLGEHDSPADNKAFIQDYKAQMVLFRNI